jgi:mannosyltransferase OCH1-like enzyme
MIPKIVHQTWRSDSLPIIFQNIYDTNKTVNPDFEFKLWSHRPGPPDIDEFIKKEYPDIYDIFNDAKYGVQKADIARIAILHHFGGIYIDLDILCLKSLSTLIDFDSENVYMALEPSEQTKKVFGIDNVLCNAFIVAPPKHPLFKRALEELKAMVKHHKTAVYNIFNAFGADLMSKSMQSDENILKSCKFINRKLVFPINDPKFSDLESSADDAAMLKKGDYKEAFMVHYWIHSDFESKELLEKFDYKNDKDIHQNVIMFFRELYPSNKHLL